MDEIITLFKKEGLKCRFNYDDGKEIRIFYDKTNFISINFDRFFDVTEIESFIQKNLNDIKKLIFFCRIVKTEKKKFNENICNIIKQYFGIEIPFSIHINDDVLYIEIRESKISFNLHKIVDFSDILFLLKDTANAKSYYKLLEKTLPYYISNEYNKDIKKLFFSILKEHYFFSDILNANKELIELSDNLRKVGIIFIQGNKMIELINKYDLSDINVYLLQPSKNGLIIKLDDIELFQIKDDIKILYDEKQIKNLYQKCLALNKLYYDFAYVFMKNNISTKNISIIFLNDDDAYIGTYSNIEKISDFNSTYEFLRTECNKIVSNQDYDVQKYTIATLNYFSTLKQCMELYGEISIDGFITQNKRFNIDKETSIFCYKKMPEMMNSLKVAGLITDYNIQAKETYKVKFASDIDFYDSVENRTRLSSLILQTASFKELINSVSEKYLIFIFSDKDLICKNSLNFINMLDNKEYCFYFRNLLKYVLPYLDKKYLPLLAFKLEKTEAEQRLGGLYDDIKNFLEGKRYDGQRI